VEATKEAAAVVVVADSEVLVLRGKGAVLAVKVKSSDKWFRDADYVPSGEDVSSGKEGGSIAGVANESDNEDGKESRLSAGERTVIVTPCLRKRKFYLASSVGIDLDDNTYWPSSLQFGG
jgi:hypothetical protein